MAKVPKSLRKHNSGKGDRYRRVDRKKYEVGYERIFGKKK